MARLKMVEDPMPFLQTHTSAHVSRFKHTDHADRKVSR